MKYQAHFGKGEFVAPLEAEDDQKAIELAKQHGAMALVRLDAEGGTTEIWKKGSRGQDVVIGFPPETTRQDK